MSNKKKILTMVKEVKETSDTNEIARLLSSGNWIAIYANLSSDSVSFVLGKI